MSIHNPLYSQAFNFGDPNQDGVDFRTGFEALNCPSLQLSLRFNSLNPQNIGVGQGWKFNLSSYNRTSNTLILSTGEHFQVAEAGSSATVKKGSDYHIIHKNGRIEILSHNNNNFDEAVTIELHATNGRSLQLAWAQIEGQTRLQAIRDQAKVLLRIEYKRDNTEIIRAPDSIETSSLTLIQNSAKLLVHLQLPLQEGSWSFTYQKLGQIACLVKIQHNEKGNRMPNRGPYQYIPCPPIVTKYSYSEENFLAYKGVGDWKKGEDNLYRAGNTYQYSMIVQVSGGRQTKYTFNKFHLLISIRQQQGKHAIATDIGYNASNDTLFRNQPAAYQFPKKMQTTFLDADGSSRVETSQYTFDDWGNLVQKIESSGIRVDRIYFPASGEKGLCPADPNGFQQHIKSEKVTPSPRTASGPSLHRTPIRKVLYKYCELPTVNKAIMSYYVAVNEVQRLEEDFNLVSVRYTYINEKNKKDRHGRLQQLDLRLNGKYETKYSWRYSSLLANQLKKTTEITTYDHYTEQSGKILSTNTGLVISYINKHGIERLVQYDKIGRITLDMVSPGKKLYEAVIKNEYAITEGTSGHSITTTDFQGLQTRQQTDGLGRICRIERQDDSDGMIGPFRVIQERKYNHLGQLITVINIDWLKLGDKSTEQRSEQRFEYDDWGCLSKTTDSSGTVILAKTNPVSMIHIEGIQGEGQTKIEFNNFHAVSRKLLLKSDGRICKKVDYTYDGLGRLVEEETNSPKSITKYQLDGFGRPVQIIRSNGRKISIQYAAHSASALPVSTKVGDYTIGTQTLDGLCRITSQTLGIRTTGMSYRGNEPSPATIRTSQGDKVDLSYDPALDYAVISVKSKDELETYQYDKRSSALLALRGSCTIEVREYLPSGLLTKEKTQIDRKKQLSTQSTYSMAGKLKTYVDVHGQMLKIQYDQCGRPKQVVQEASRTTFAYDKGGRLSERCCYDDGKKQSLKTSLKYDEFGREIERIIFAGKALLYQIEQTFNETSLLKNRTLKDEKGKLLREESFEYDQQSRLVNYKHQGAQPIIDEAGQKIQSQQFSFDKYDNPAKIVNTFEDGSKNTRNFFYKPEDPTQLTKITNTHKKYATEIAFLYDRNGRLIRDEQGRKLDYDAKGRLSMVSDAKDKILSQYYYDASGKLVCQKAGLLDTYLHYRGNRLVAITSGDQKINSHQSILAWFDTQKPENIRHQQYMPYGYGVSDVLGFNGQWKDPITGWYHLGNGCRVYNAVLMRFHSPDQWNSFLTGEINPYSYCLNDPINHVDTMAHVSTFGMDDLGASNSILSQSLSPLQVTFREGPLLNGPERQPPWTDQVARIPGLQDFMPHGDTSGSLFEGLWGDTATNMAQHIILPTIQQNIDYRERFFPQQLGRLMFLFSCNGADPISFGGEQLAPTGQRVAGALNRGVIAFHGELNFLPELKAANMGALHNILETDGGVQRVYEYDMTWIFQLRNG
ncbi:hypothetical protein ACQKWADRAFT_330880 [Trichoderma austrokoningii]